MDWKEKNKEILKDTLEITETGQYHYNETIVYLKESKEDQKKSIVFTEEETTKLRKEHILQRNTTYERAVFSVSNQDSYEAAIRIMNSYTWKSQKYPKKVLVLNFANPVQPGGGVRYGSRAQEEDLCRRSTLLVSLEAPESRGFYENHRKLSHSMASDAMILSPTVEVFRKKDGTKMAEPATVSILTCAAPNIGYSKKKPSEETLAKIFYQRILAMLHVACQYGYRYLVFGAWGCGEFGNDAKLVAEQFAKALQDFHVTIIDSDEKKNQIGSNECFRYIEFAVLDSTEEQYRYQSFLKAFPEERYKEYQEKVERDAKNVIKRRIEKQPYEDAIRGCMVGGGIGDALGYPIEFWSESEIYHTYGENGMTSYSYSSKEGLAVVSDDTQMTMFTATGILHGYTRGYIRGIMGPISDYVYHHYMDWLHTQNPKIKGSNQSWLREIPNLYVCRAPGMTCLDSLESHTCGTRKNPLNHSKGCGGVMRVAPMALYLRNYQPPLSFEQLKRIDCDGADIAAITHGHPLGYIPAAALVHIINRIVYGYGTFDDSLYGDSLYKITAECRMAMEQIFEGEAYLPKFLEKLDLAVELSRNTKSDIQNIQKLGQGWVAEEAFAIALYCSLRYSNDFSKAIIAAVNHDGDSDSTGAITGNIVGAIVGYQQIEKKWKQQLEFHQLLLELADDLCYGCQMSEYSSYEDQDWFDKYMVCRKPKRNR